MRIKKCQMSFFLTLSSLECFCDSTEYFKMFSYVYFDVQYISAERLM